MRKRRPLRFYFPMLLALLLVVPAAVVYRANVNAREEVADRRTFRLLDSEAEHLAGTLKRIGATVKLAGDACVQNEFEQCVRPYLKNYLPGFVDSAALKKTDTNRPEQELELEGSTRYLSLWRAGKNIPVSVRLELNDVLKSSASETAIKQFRTLALVADDGTVWAQLDRDPVRITNLAALLEQSKEASGQVKNAQQGWKSPNPLDSGSMKYAVDLQGTRFFAFVQPTAVRLPLVESENDNKGAATPIRAFVLAGLMVDQDYHAVTREIPLAYVAELTAFALALAGLLAPMLRVRTMSSRERITRTSCSLMLCQFVGAILLMTLVYLNWGFSITIRQRTQIRLQAMAERIRRNFSQEVFDALVVLGDKGPLLSQLEPKTGSSRIATLDVAESAFGKQQLNPYPFFNRIFCLRNPNNPIELSLDSVPSTMPAGYNLDEVDKLKNEASLVKFKKRDSIPFRLIAPDAETSLLTREEVPPEETASVPLQMETRLVSVVGPVVPYGFSFAVIDRDGLVQFHSDKTRNQTEKFFEELDRQEEARRLVQLHTSGPFEARYRGIRSMFYLLPISPQTPSNAPEQPEVTNLDWYVVAFRDGGYIDGLKFEVGKAFLLGLIPLIGVFIYTRVAAWWKQRDKGDALSKLLPLVDWRRIWPKEGRRNDYALFTVFGLIWVALACFLICGLAPRAGVNEGWFLAAALPIIGILLAKVRRWVINLGGPERWDQVKRWAAKFLGREGIATLYSLRVVVFLLAVPGMAGLLVYSCALNWTQYVHREVLTQQGDFALRQRKRAIEEDLNHKNLGPYAAAIRQARLDSKNDLDNYDLFATEGRCKLVNQMKEQPQVWVFRFLAGIPGSIPGSESGAAPYGMGLPPLSAPCEVTTSPDPAPFRNFKSDDLEQNATGLWAALPVAWISVESWLFYAVGIGLLGVLGIGVLRVVAPVFFLETWRPEPLDGLEDEEEFVKQLENKRSAFVVHQPLAKAYARLKAAKNATVANALVIDLATQFEWDTEEELNASLADAIAKARSAQPGQLVIVDNLEHRLGERAFETCYLHLLEELVYNSDKQTKIIVLSTVDPQEYLMAAPGDNLPGAEGCSTFQRWVRVLSSFRFWSSSGEQLDWRVNEQLRAMLDGKGPIPGETQEKPKSRRKWKGCMTTFLDLPGPVVSVSGQTGHQPVLSKEEIEKKQTEFKTKLTKIEKRMEKEFADVFVQKPSHKARYLQQLKAVRKAAVQDVEHMRKTAMTVGATVGSGTVLMGGPQATPGQSTAVSWDTIKRVVYLCHAGRLLLKRKLPLERLEKLAREHEPSLRNVCLDEVYRLHHQFEDHFRAIREELECFDHFSAEPGRLWTQIVESVLKDFPGSIGQYKQSSLSRKLAETVREDAEQLYRRIWSNSREDERLVLFQLAADGWANPKNRAALAHLVRRRVVQFRDGEGYWLSRSFQWFVKDVQDLDEVDHWIAQQRASMWSSLRLGFITLGALGCFAILYLGQGLLNSYFGSVVAVCGTLFTAVQLILELFKKPPRIHEGLERGDAR